MAGEPESLATHEPLADRVQRHDYDRLIMLSDGVFAIAITLLALELRLPEEWDGGLATLLDGSGRSLVGYVFGFLLVGAFWILHRRLFAKIYSADRVVTFLNIILLGLIGLVPFIARLIAEKGATRSIPVYLLLTGTIFASYAVLYAAAGIRRCLHPEVGDPRWHKEALGLGLGAAIILAGSAFAFASESALSPVALAAIAIAAALSGRFVRRMGA